MYYLLDLHISVPVSSLQYNTTQLTEAERSPYSSVMIACVIGNKKLLSEQKKTDRNFHIESRSHCAY